jgi:hypothetical protein
MSQPINEINFDAEDKMEDGQLDADTIGSEMSIDTELEHGKKLSDEYAALEKERAKLQKQLRDLEEGRGIISDAYGLLATVPGLEVDVILNYPPEPHPNDTSGIVLFQPYVVIKMKEGEMLNMYPARKGTESLPIAIKRMETMADDYKDRGIVLWNGTKLPEDGGESKEQAIKRGLNNFLDYYGRIEYSLMVQKMNTKQYYGESSVPNDDILRITEPTTMKMRKIAELVKQKLEQPSIGAA